MTIRHLTGPREGLVDGDPTPRQWEYIRAWEDGLTYPQIAARLRVSAGTVAFTLSMLRGGGWVGRRS